MECDLIRLDEIVVVVDPSHLKGVKSTRDIRIAAAIEGVGRGSQGVARLRKLLNVNSDVEGRAIIIIARDSCFGQSFQSGYF